MARRSLYNGKMSGAEMKADYVTDNREAADIWAAGERATGLKARVKVVKTRRGLPRLWGVFVKLPPDEQGH